MAEVPHECDIHYSGYFTTGFGGGCFYRCGCVWDDAADKIVCGQSGPWFRGMVRDQRNPEERKMDKTVTIITYESPDGHGIAGVYDTQTDAGNDLRRIEKVEGHEYQFEIREIPVGSSSFFDDMIDDFKERVIADAERQKAEAERALSEANATLLSMGDR